MNTCRPINCRHCQAPETQIRAKQTCSQGYTENLRAALQMGKMGSRFMHKVFVAIINIKSMAMYYERSKGEKN